ncbi:unnamed protein product, partial [Adineta ricciae]
QLPLVFQTTTHNDTYCPQNPVNQIIMHKMPSRTSPLNMSIPTTDVAGIVLYRQKCDKVADNNHEGFQLEQITNRQ